MGLIITVKIDTVHVLITVYINMHSMKPITFDNYRPEQKLKFNN